MPNDTCAELGQQEGIREPTEKSDLWIVNVRLPLSPANSEEERDDYDGTWIVKCSDSFVTDVLRSPEPSHIESTIDNVQILDANGGIMIPSSVVHSRRDCDDTMLRKSRLCHSHIHLDKCFILDQCGDLTDGYVSQSVSLLFPPVGKISLRLHYHCPGSTRTSLPGNSVRKSLGI